MAVQLQRRGYAALSCRAAGNADKGLSDEWQLAYATSQQHTILTHNIADYVTLDRSWKLQQREHRGIIVVPKRTPFGELFRRLQRHLDTVPPDVQYNVLLYLA